MAREEKLWQVLACPMRPNDACADTVREYLILLLQRLWEEEEGFSGKRPFGNSGWKFEIYAALVDEGIVRGKFCSDGTLDYVDTKTANVLIFDAIATLF